jgi:hypothetical protein
MRGTWPPARSFPCRTCDEAKEQIMADPHQGAPAPRPKAANQNRIQPGGHDAHAAPPLNAAPDEPRSFDPEDAPTPHLGARGDPAEGRR